MVCGLSDIGSAYWGCIERTAEMSLEAWGDENPSNNDPVRTCPACGGTGYQIRVTGRGEHGDCEQESCDRCDGTGEVSDEYEPLPDDVI